MKRVTQARIETKRVAGVQGRSGRNVQITTRPSRINMYLIRYAKYEENVVGGR